MDKVTFWKNFKLGEELDISGRFIYNGLRYLYEIETLYYEVEIFEILYNLSVGMERLLKIAVILIEHDDKVDQDEFEKSLITHNHLELLRRIKKKYPMNLAASHNALLQMLGTFYSKQRYGRYGIQAMKTTGDEKIALHSYLNKYLKIEIHEKPPFIVVRNSEKIQKYLSKQVGKITNDLYEVIQNEAGRLNIYTYEVRSNSKASKIFLRKKYDFIDEDVLFKELVIYLINTKDSSRHLEFIKEIEPLAFDPALIADYIQCLGSDEKKLDILNELEALYDGISDSGNRLEVLSIIGNPCIYFDPIDDDNAET